MGSFTRNAATDHADIVAYNPAGTVKLDDGFTANLGLQYLIEKDYANEFTGTRDAYTGTEYESTEPSAIPNFYSVYNAGPWAAFFGVNVPVGGGKVDYENGNFVTYSVAQGVRAQANGQIYQSAVDLAGSANPVQAATGAALLAALTPAYGGPLTAGTNTGPYSVQSHRIEAESYGLGYTLGGAYQFNEMFSASIGLRYIDSKVDMAGNAVLKLDPNLPPVLAGLGLAPKVRRNIAFDAEATGWGGIVGLDVFPNDKVTIGLRFETPTELEYEYNVSEGAAVLRNVGITQGAKKRDDLPGTFGAGLGYAVTDRFRLETNLTYYFNKGADIGGTTLRENLEDTVNDGWEIAVGGSYQFTKALRGTAGYMYTDIGVAPEDSSKFLPDLDAHSVGVGLIWSVLENVDLTFALGNVYYTGDGYVDNSLVAQGVETSPTTVNYSKNIPYVGGGVQFSF
jgi:long-chain fatty acid transport protein